MQQIGEYKIKRPKFILFLDKDGTTNLDDKNLNNIFNLVSTMGGMVIFVTGRTVGDIEEELRDKKIKVPEIIAGDNGAAICYTKTGEFIEQKRLNHDNVLKMVGNFIQHGGNNDYIRFTNGREVFASEEKDVERYYKKNKNVKLCQDISETIKQTEEITKLTLAGSKDLMLQVSEFATSLDCWTDMDGTKFPKKECQNYRLDIAQRNINKGEAIKVLIKMLAPEYGYMCVGNGYNDISMFQVAIDDGMRVAIMPNSDSDLFEQVKKYSQEKKRGKVEKVPHDKNLANQYIWECAKRFQADIAEQQNKGKKRKRFPNVERFNVGRIEQRNGINYDNWKTEGRDR